MNNLSNALATLTIASSMVCGAFAQHRSSSDHRDWHWEDTSRWHRDLNLSSSQGSRISSINKRASDAIRKLNTMDMTGQERARSIAAIRAQARRDIQMVLNTRQRSTLHSHGFSFDDRREVHTLRRRGGDDNGHHSSGHSSSGKSKGKGKGKGGGG